MRNQTKKYFKLPPLPKICVIGPQSCGKSSVLSRIIGHDILPTGQNLTTKCVIEINLRNVCDSSCHRNKKTGKKGSGKVDDEYKQCAIGSTSEFNSLLKKLDLLEKLNNIHTMGCNTSKPRKRNAKSQEYAIFDDTPDNKYSIEGIKDQIILRMNQQLSSDELSNPEPDMFPDRTTVDLGSLEKTSKIQKKNRKAKSIVSECIESIPETQNTHSIYGPNKPFSETTLKSNSFVEKKIQGSQDRISDTPGIVHLSKSTQQDDISHITKHIAQHHIINCDIVLAIINGCVDIVNSESLAISNQLRSLDKTIGVLTKIDKGNCKGIQEILRNEAIILKHGYFGLVNIDPSQNDPLHKDSDVSFPSKKNPKPKKSNHEKENPRNKRYIIFDDSSSDIIPSVYHHDHCNRQQNGLLSKITNTSISFFEEQEFLETAFFDTNYSMYENVGLATLKKHLASMFEAACYDYFKFLQATIREDFNHTINFHGNPYYRFKYLESWLNNINDYNKSIIKDVLYDNSQKYNRRSTDFDIEFRSKTHNVYLTDLPLELQNDTIFLDEQQFLQNLQIKLYHLRDQLIELTLIISERIKDLTIMNSTVLPEKHTPPQKYYKSNIIEGASRKPSTKIISKDDSQKNKTPKSSFLFTIFPFLKKKGVMEQITTSDEDSMAEQSCNSDITISTQQSLTRIQSNTEQALEISKEPLSLKQNHNDTSALSIEYPRLSDFNSYLDSDSSVQTCSLLILPQENSPHIRFYLNILKTKKSLILDSINQFITLQTVNVNLQHDRIKNRPASEVRSTFIPRNNNKMIKYTSKFEVPYHKNLLQCTNHYLSHYFNQYYLILKDDLVQYSVNLLYFHFTRNDLVEQMMKENHQIDDKEIERIKQIVNLLDDISKGNEHSI